MEEPTQLEDRTSSNSSMPEEGWRDSLLVAFRAETPEQKAVSNFFVCATMAYQGTLQGFMLAMPFVSSEKVSNKQTQRGLHEVNRLLSPGTRGWVRLGWCLANGWGSAFMYPLQLWGVSCNTSSTYWDPNSSWSSHGLHSYVFG
eukprot:Blabericola_migrator_1__4854@NODE_2542_length_2627_cov_219_626563_g454_i2_p4_GENE_NODE_2542_length_2627_cov_219_626563_g454_i2NODE_2542_length_2627_cov_219_626563_g454_i2_p4_ORF_typecomplete_len144_score13_44_NODE_2542_length_2627_cov_219_626563_g454_i213411772